MTRGDSSFRVRYDAQQDQWRQLAKRHDHHYLRYLAPRAPADFVLVAKMTSISEKEAAETPHGEHPAKGLNLLVSLGDLILNYGARRHLCKPGETYYLTDLGKCAIPPKKAKGKLEDEEFKTWYPALLEELELVANPCATVIPVGSATGKFLRRHPDFPYLLTEPILHWSTAATAAAKMAGSLFPQEWKEFRQTTTWEDLRASTEEILVEARLGQDIEDFDHRFKGRFRDIHMNYMFTYKKEMPLRRPSQSQT